MLLPQLSHTAVQIGIQMVQADLLSAHRGHSPLIMGRSTPLSLAISMASS